MVYIIIGFDCSKATLLFPITTVLQTKVTTESSSQTTAIYFVTNRR